MYFSDLESLKTSTKTGIVDVSFSVVDTFNELQNQIQKLSEDVTRFTVNEAEILKDALSSGSNFKKLDKLDHLSKIENEFSSFKSQSSDQSKEIKKSIDSMNKNISNLVKYLKYDDVSRINDCIDFFKRCLNDSNRWVKN
jgi:replication fork clamp-binding protein CrfC